MINKTDIMQWRNGGGGAEIAQNLELAKVKMLMCKKHCNQLYMTVCFDT